MTSLSPPSVSTHMDRATAHVGYASLKLDSATADASLNPALKKPLEDLSRMLSASVELLAEVAAASRVPH